MIRAATNKDFNAITEIWLNASLQAHCFIPTDYWHQMAETVIKYYLPTTETYVMEDRHQIQGFVSIMENNYIGALFVTPEHQGQKIGSKLLAYVRRHRPTLNLKVFVKNPDAIKFYQFHGFKIVAEQQDVSTKETELMMSWAVGCLSGFQKRHPGDS